MNKDTGKPIRSSAHYIIGRDGEVVQMVLNADTAHHASQANSRSIGIEHNANKPTRSNPRDLPPTAEQYEASARLVAWLCRADRHPGRPRAHPGPHGNLARRQPRLPELDLGLGLLHGVRPERRRRACGAHLPRPRASPREGTPLRTDVSLDDVQSAGRNGGARLLRQALHRDSFNTRNDSERGQEGRAPRRFEYGRDALKSGSGRGPRSDAPSCGWRPPAGCRCSGRSRTSCRPRSTRRSPSRR